MPEPTYKIPQQRIDSTEMDTRTHVDLHAGSADLYPLETARALRAATEAIRRQEAQPQTARAIVIGKNLELFRKEAA